jgi:hypothetical protein
MNSPTSSTCGLVRSFRPSREASRREVLADLIQVHEHCPSRRPVNLKGHHVVVHVVPPHESYVSSIADVGDGRHHHVTFTV